MIRVWGGQCRLWPESGKVLTCFCLDSGSACTLAYEQASPAEGAGEGKGEEGRLGGEGKVGGLGALSPTTNEDDP